MKALWGCLLLLWAGPVMAADGFWIWSPGDQALQGVPTGQVRFFRRTFDLAARPERAEVKIKADDRYTLFVNGQEVGSDDDWYIAETYDVAEHLRAGRNVMAVQAENNEAGPAGLLVRVVIETGAGEPLRLASDHTWRAAAEAGAGWTEAGYDDSGWAEAEELAPQFGGPWGGGTNELPRPVEELHVELLAAYRQLVRTQLHQRGLNVVPRPHEMPERARGERRERGEREDRRGHWATGPLGHWATGPLGNQPQPPGPNFLISQFPSGTLGTSEGLDLVRDGQPQVSLLACYIDEEEMFAARLFQAAVEELSGVKLDLLDAAVTPFGPGQVWIIRAGCGALPDPAQEQAARAAELSPEGYTLRWHDFDPQPPVRSSAVRRPVRPSARSLRSEIRNPKSEIRSVLPSVLAIGHEDPGVLYQVHTLVQLLEVEGKTVRLPRVTLDDWPDAPVRGIVGWTQVEDLAWLSFYKYNAIAYSLNALQPFSPDLVDLTNYARRWGIELIGFWHPTEDFCYSDTATLDTLAQHLREAATLGFRSFSINVDDFPNETVTDEDKARFGPGLEGLFRAQQAMLRYVHEAVEGEIDLWFCPRVYYDVRHVNWEPAPPDPAAVAYRAGLGDLPAGLVLWTTQPQLDYLRETNRLWRRKPMIWHNYFLEFSQCDARYFAAYPTVPRKVLDLSAGLWTEGDQFQGRTRASYVTHAAAIWNAAATVSLADALAREYGAEAGAALAEYAKHLGGGREPRGELVDHWDQPDDFPAKLFGTNSAGLLPHLPPGTATARSLRARAADAAHARSAFPSFKSDRSDQEGEGTTSIPPDLANALRTDAEKIELNFRAFAARAELSGKGLPEDRRAAFTEELRQVLARLRELGATEEYLTDLEKVVQ